MFMNDKPEMSDHSDKEVYETYRQIAETNRVQGLNAVTALLAQLTRVRRSLIWGEPPDCSPSGDLDLVACALNVQRHVDAWRAAVEVTHVVGPT